MNPLVFMDHTSIHKDQIQGKTGEIGALTGGERSQSHPKQEVAERDLLREDGGNLDQETRRDFRGHLEGEGHLDL